MTEGISRSRDGVPQWSGDSRTFQEYEEACLQWEQSIAVHKRYLCGPRLQGELGGTAKKYGHGKRADWISWNGGVEHLLAHLRRSLGKPQIQDLSDYLTKFFRNSRRKKFESMNDYIIRKTELYGRARQALNRVQEHYDQKTKMGGSHSWSSGSHHDRRQRRWPWWDQTWYDGGWRTREGDGEFHDVESGAAQADDESQADDHRQETQSQWSQGGSWDYRSSWQGAYGRSEEAGWREQAPELLPDFLQGWYLLSDAGLDSHERNMIQTETAGDFSVDTIAQALRNQWSEEDLQRRDQGHRHSGFWQEDLSDDMDGGDEGANYSTAHLVESGMTDEGLALMTSAAEQVEEAMAMVEEGRRTLREARAKQHQVKLSRKYYQTSGSTSGGTSGVQKKTFGGGIKCFKCGGPTS